MSDFEQAFATALRSPDAGREPAPFAVYRNTFAMACADALEANYPALVRLLGRDWFRAMAVAYARAHPPVQSQLLTYGDAHFGAWLQGQAERAAPGRDWCYLQGVAQLDDGWRSCHAAADARPLDVAALRLDDAAGLVFRPHPAARWAWFGRGPIYTIWSRNREPQTQDAVALVWQAEGALLTRPHDPVRWQLLPHAGCLLLDACAQGQCLAEAVSTVLAQAPEADLPGLIGQLVAAGAWSQPEI